MVAWKGGFDGVGRTLPEVEAWLKGRGRVSWVTGITVHNTGVPGLTRAREIGLSSYVRNAGAFFRNPPPRGRGWSGGPHFFVGEDQKVYFGTPFILPGVHDPCRNASAWGIEMIANFDGKEDDDDAGKGLLVKQTCAELVGLLLRFQGLAAKSVSFHKECKKTTHDCPGKDVEKPEFMSRVLAFAPLAPLIKQPAPVVAEIPQKGQEHNPRIIPEIGNVTTFDVKEGPAFTFNPPTPAEVIDRPAWGVRLFRDLRWSKIASCCMVAQFQEEAFADLRTNAMGDKHIPGGSISLGQWNRERKQAFLDFCAVRGVEWDDFEVAILFANWELERSEISTGKALAQAVTIYSGCKAAIGYERPAGWSVLTPTRPPSWQRRLDKAIALYNRTP